MRLPAWAAPAPIRPAMIGSVQERNIRHALVIVNELVRREIIPSAPPARFARALAACRLPGRGELIGDVFLDGAHTPQSVQTVVEAFHRRFGEDVRTPVILGIVAGKDVEGIAKALGEIATRVLVSTPGRFKPGDPEDVAERAEQAGLSCELITDAYAALQRARAAVTDARVPILVTGSFYMVAEIRRIVLT